ncbi:MAG: hypothetical protein LBH31_05345 [Burkholderiaceae bacterium]|jgi:hypothetical protein|nr:hypothetical protein [Burkholderiaceae bacterium]
MKYKMKFGLAAVLGCVALLAGCASEPSKSSAPGVLQVAYSTRFIDGSVLKEPPTEVTIVRRETTGRSAAAQVGLNVLMLALGGGVAVKGFSKNDLKGERIEDASDRTNLQNPVQTAFVQSLQEAVNARMTQNHIGQDRSFRYPLLAGGGSANLIYDTLLGSEDAQYRLVLHLDVYKRRENSWVMPPILVKCSDQSDPPQPLAYWSESSYSHVRQELDRMLAACQEKVLADLPSLLESSDAI